jgi:choline dehydrogenase-like flavoprotein
MRALIGDLVNCPDRVIDVEICIIGAGPTGYTIAAELARTGRSILVLESGAKDGETEFAAGLNQVENVGQPRIVDQRQVRNRTLGGSSSTWSGRCAILDPIDYALRSWVPRSGWPVSENEMKPYVRRAADYLGLQHLDCTEAELAGCDVPTGGLTLEESDLRWVLWQFSRSNGFADDYVRFGPQFERLRADNVRVLTNATATELVPSIDGKRIEEIRILAPDRTAYKVRSRWTILCGGGIENARLLLASRCRDSRGVANSGDMVGRFLADHARTTLGTFAPQSCAQIQKTFGLFRHSSGTVVQRGLSPGFAIQKRNCLLNSAAWTTQHVADDDVWRALRNLRQSRAEKRALGGQILQYSDQIINGLWSMARGKSLPRRMGPLHLDAVIEQPPDPESRITLSGQSDALGMPLARIDWRIGQMERRTAIYLGHAVNGALLRAGLPAADLTDWIQNRRPENACFIDQAHPIGTTRMSDRESQGVVDRNCRVHGMDNLFIAGSSVFPTGGHANPTLMIVAMAIRLADHLRYSQLSEPEMIERNLSLKG